MPSWRVIAWGGEHDAPVNIIASAWALPHEPVHVTAKAPAGLAYIAAVSPFGAFVVRYRGVGGGGIGVARASQLQLAQPLLTLVWSVLLLGEHCSPALPLATVIVLGCIVIAQRART